MRLTLVYLIPFLLALQCERGVAPGLRHDWLLIVYTSLFFKQYNTQLKIPTIFFKIWTDLFKNIFFNLIEILDQKLHFDLLLLDDNPLHLSDEHLADEHL